MHSERLTRFLSIKDQGQIIHARDIAAHLGITEAELACSRTGYDAQRLTPDVPAIISALADAGPLKGITRNNSAVHEHTGRYINAQFGEHACLLLNPYGLDLRFFLSQWHTIFAFAEAGKNGIRHSLQFFDRHGDAVHKIYTLPETDMPVWHALVTQFAITDAPPVSPEPVIPEEHMPLPLEQQAEFAQRWQEMTDVHQFFVLLKKYRLSRTQAFRCVDNSLAQRVDNQALSRLLTDCVTRQNEIMIFVANRGCVQIFTGAITRTEPWISPRDGQHWVNIFNPDFTLHLIESAITESWITRKPTKDGIVTSLELFGADGQPVAQLFGQRTEGMPEQTTWRNQIDALLTALPADTGAVA